MLDSDNKKIYLHRNKYKLFKFYLDKNKDKPTVV